MAEGEGLEDAGKLVGSDSLLVRELSKGLLRAKRISVYQNKTKHAKCDMRVGSVGFYI